MTTSLAPSPTDLAAAAELLDASPEGVLCACGCGLPTRIAPKNCKTYGWVKGAPLRFVKGHNQRGMLRESAPNWKGGRSVASSGYVTIYAPDHPRSDVSGVVYEHVLIAERALRRPLARKHPVHHVDENKANNENGNLVLCENNAYHRLLHQRQRALYACGDANALRCHLCGRYDHQEDIRRYGAPRRPYHQSCLVQRADSSRRRRKGQC